MFKQLSIQNKNGFINDEINLQFVIAHTLSHILINEFSYFAGYSATSMSEKIYVNINQDSEMNGILIYTAAGDSEGTLGGLVQLGLPENLDKIIFLHYQNLNGVRQTLFVMKVCRKVLLV